jgi:hypothetical protein
MKFPSIVRRYGSGSKRRFTLAEHPNFLLELVNETERASLDGTNGGWIKRGLLSRPPRSESNRSRYP